MAETSRYDLFLEITQNLEDTEIRDLRTYISNKRLLPARGLQQMDPQQIFVKLEHAGKLKKGDLSLLVDLMTKINRDDFAKEAKRIAKQEGKALPNKSDSSDEELPDSPAKRLKLPKPPRRSAKNTSTNEMKKRKEKEDAPEADEDSDEGDGKIDVKVEPCDEDVWMKITQEKKPYRMDSNPRGYALILNNTTFTKLPYRKGGAVDLSNITALLEGLSFETHILEEKISKEIADEVLAFSQRKQHKQADCCVVVLMSHGDAGVIFGTDDKPVKLEDIFAMFDNENCPRLMDKPKLFFIQACPKVNKDEADSSASDVKVDLKSEMRSLLHLPADETDGPGAQSTRTDMLCGYATQLGYKSFRNRENGSWFIQDITKVFMEHAKDKSLREMMKMVKEDVSKRTARCNNPAEDGGKEVAEFDHTLQKPLYFFPGVE
ncbi:CASP2 [Branchiostoma lanceolatum]|uniref:CASP2 protein n=1 Tax=Branchiostoma lanceolatum TaxID=7740 RepID=A0A8K0EP74_BRALA|nr:CASP2 [Branchiostoma lanceolatum]